MVTDFMGKELKPGDLIVYPCRSGSNLWMTSARIVEVIEQKSENLIKARKENGFLVTVSRVDNVVKIEEPSNG